MLVLHNILDVRDGLSYQHVSGPVILTGPRYSALNAVDLLSCTINPHYWHLLPFDSALQVRPLIFMKLVPRCPLAILGNEYKSCGCRWKSIAFRQLGHSVE